MKVTIGDLAIMAANYGKDANSPDWQQATDLAFVASKMGVINNGGGEVCSPLFSFYLMMSGIL
jgi:hypothetical protein